MDTKKTEIAYRKPGEGWKRKTVKDSQLEKTILKLEDAGAEIMCRDAEESR